MKYILLNADQEKMFNVPRFVSLTIKFGAKVHRDNEKGRSSDEILRNNILLASNE